MPIVSAGDLTLLRSEFHKHAIYFSWLIPPVLWSARINDGSIVKGEPSIAFNGGSGSFFSMVEGVQEVWVGTVAGADDVGRLRIKSISSGDAGVTGTLTVGGHSLPLQDAQFLTFLHDYPLKPKFSYIDPGSENWFMDDDVNYTDQHDEPQPVVIAGSHRADFIAEGASDVVFNVDASNSYAIESGASITSYGLSVASTAATPAVSFSSVTGLGDITFDTPGYYWAKYTATDSNGKSMDSYRLYMIHDFDEQLGPFPWTFLERLQLENDWENGGWTAGLRASDDFTISDIPKHALCIIWQEGSYGGTIDTITHLPDDNKAVFVGYVREDSDTQDMAAGFGEVDLVLSTVEGRLRRLFNFSTSLIVKNGAPTEWFEYRAWQTPGTIVHDLFLWRSTLLEIADVIGLKDDTVNRMFQAFDEGNIYDNANNFLYTEAIRKRILCDQGGRVYLSADQQLLVDADRGALTTVMPLIQTAAIADYGESLVLESKQEFDVPFVTAGGIFWNGSDFDGDDKPESTGEWCSIAPGGKPLYNGPNPQDFPKETVTSQANLNALTGRYEAKLNNPIAEIVLKFHGAYSTILDCAYSEEFTMDLQASENPRGISWSDKPLYLRHVQAVYDSRMGAWEVHASFEPENITSDGVTTECPSFPPLGGEVPTIPPPEEVGGGGALLTGASVNFRSNSGDLWVQRLTEDVKDLIPDPWWRTKQPSSSPSVAIVFRCGLGYIKRSTDAFISVDVDVTPGTNPPNDAGDSSPVPTVGAVTFKQMEGNWITQDSFVALATWQNGSGVWRTWLAHTVDNGTTWTWQSVGTAAGPGGPIVFDTYGSDHDAIVGPAAEIAGFFNVGTNRAIATLSETKCVVVWQEDTVGGGGDNDGVATVLTISGDTITAGGTDYVYNEISTIDTPRAVRMIVLDSTHIIIAYTWFNVNDWNLKMVIGTVSGTSISFGAYESVTLPADSDMGNIDIALLSSSKMIVMYDDQRTIIVGHYDHYIRVVNISGTNLTANAAHLVTGNPDHTFRFKIATLDGTRCVMIYNKLSDGPVALPFDVSATTPTFGSPVDLFSISGMGYGGGTAYPVNATRFLFMYQQNQSLVDSGDAIRFTTGVISGSIGSPVLTLSGQTHVMTTHATRSISNLQATQITGDHLLVSYFQSGGSGNERYKFAVVASGGFVSSTAESDSGYVSGSETDTEGLSLTKAIHFREFAPDMDAYIINFELNLVESSLVTRGLGLSMGKASGGKVWVTANVNDELRLLEYSTPALVLGVQPSMGAATFSETAVKSYLCYPFTPYGLEDTVYVFGRMNDAQSLGNPVHIIKTTDGGTVFTLIENGWTFDHCGALAVSQFFEMFAIRNQGAKAALYRDTSDEILIAKYTLPFDGPVAPHGMLLDYATREVYIGSNFVDPIMVVLVPPPHLTVIDLTFNHDNTEGIESIVGL